MGELLKHDPLAFADQVEAPLECGTEGLLPWRRRSPPAPFELQPAVEQRRHLAQPIETDACGSKLDRERDPVELAANPSQDFRILVGDIVTVSGRDCAIHEQTRSRIA
ncbi:hypothetical protein ACVWW4_007749 [Bradyrhizobium sp. LB7.1]